MVSPWHVPSQARRNIAFEPVSVWRSRLHPEQRLPSVHNLRLIADPRRPRKLDVSIEVTK